MKSPTIVIYLTSWEILFLFFCWLSVLYNLTLESYRLKMNSVGMVLKKKILLLCILIFFMLRYTFLFTSGLPIKIIDILLTDWKWNDRFWVLTCLLELMVVLENQWYVRVKDLIYLFDEAWGMFSGKFQHFHLKWRQVQFQTLMFKCFLVFLSQSWDKYITCMLLLWSLCANNHSEIPKQLGNKKCTAGSLHQNIHPLCG